MKNNHKRTTLKFNIFLMFLAMALGLNFVISITSFAFYSDTLNSEIEKTSIGFANSVASGINGNRVRDWLERSRMEEYSLSEKEIISFVKSNNNVKKITVAKMLSNEMQILFEVGFDKVNKHFLNKIPYSDELETIKNDLLYGYHIDPIKDESGQYIISLTPVKSSLDEVECYVICEMSLGDIASERKILINTLIITLMISIFVISAVYLYLKGSLVSPLTRVAEALKRFAEDNRLGDITKRTLLDVKNNSFYEIKKMNEDFLGLINDVKDSSERVEDIGHDIIKNVSGMVNKRNIKDTSNTDAIKDYTLIIFDNLLQKRKYKKLLTDVFMDAVITAVPLYDIGEITISDDILNKTGSLTDEEYELIKRHTESGYELIDEVMGGLHDEYYINVAKDMAKYHHERWDGSGYMSKLKGKQIPFSARVIAVADVFNALVSNKFYRDGKTIDEAFDIIRKGRRKLFDKNIADAFLKGENSVRRIARKYTHNKNE